MTTNHPLATHDDEACRDGISSRPRVNLMERLRQLYVRIQHGAAENRQACVASFQKCWEKWQSRTTRNVKYASTHLTPLLLLSSVSLSTYAATIYIEPGETKTIQLNPTLKTDTPLPIFRKGTYQRRAFCLNSTIPLGTASLSSGCKSPSPGWTVADRPKHTTADTQITVLIKYAKVTIDYTSAPLTWTAEFRPSSGVWSWLSGPNSVQTPPSPPALQWVYAGGANVLTNMPKNAGGSFQTTMPSHNYTLNDGKMLFDGTTATITAAASAIPGTIYYTNPLGASTNTMNYEVWPGHTIIVSHPCFVGVPAVQNIPFGNVFVSGVTVGTESTTVIQNKISCAGAVANRKYTITSTGTATGATSIPLKETGGGGTTQGNIYIKTATGGGCSTTGARTMGTAYTLPAKGSNVYSEDLYATLCNVKNGAAGKGSATATITYDWN